MIAKDTCVYVNNILYYYVLIDSFWNS